MPQRIFISSILVFLSGLSLLGVFREEMASPFWRSAWILGFILLSLNRIVRFLSGSAHGKTINLEFYVLGILGLNVCTQVTGGLNSGFFPAYLVLLVMSSFRERPFYYQFSALFILVLEGVNSPGLFQEGEGLGFRFIGWAAIFFLVPVSVRLGIRSLVREKTELKIEIQRFDSTVQAVGPSRPLDSHPRLSALTEDEEVRRMAPVHSRFDRTVETLFWLMKEAIPLSHHCLLFLPAGRRGSFRIHKWVGGDPEKLKMDIVIRDTRGVVGFSVREKRFFRTGRIGSGVSFPEYCRPAVPLASIMVLPLEDSGHIEGILVMDSLEADAFGKKEEQTFRNVGRELVEGIHYLRKQENVESRSDQMSTLLAIGESLGSSLDLNHRLTTMAEKVREVIPYDNCFVFLVESGQRRAELRAVKGKGEKGWLGKFVPLNSGFLSIIVKRRMLLADQDLGKRSAQTPFFPEGCGITLNPSSFMALPMVAGDQVIGLFVLTSQKPNAFDKKQAGFLKALCAQAALSISDAQLHDEVNRLATTDGLTGVFNHRRFQQKLEEELERQGREGRPFVLLMVDVDFFKKFNDRFGHPEGDRILKEVAGVLRCTVRRVDFVARYGGEEFAVIFINSGQQEGFRLSERIRKAVEKLNPVIRGESVKITVSLGMAECPSDGVTRQDLIRRADEALYQAKREGRNRTIRAHH